MILVDSSVWVSYFNKILSRETSFLHQCLGTVPIATGDIILAEVLRGFKSDKAYLKARELMSSLIYIDMLGKKVSALSINIYRDSRKKGITIKKPNDLFIASFCITNKIPLLHADQDFDLIAGHSKLEVIAF